MASNNKNDDVNHPKHYTSDPSGVECIDITRHRNFNIGNAIKYLWRAGLKCSSGTKDLQISTAVNKQTKKTNANSTVLLTEKTSEIQDLNKAVWYLVDEIHRLGGRCTVKTDSINTCLPIDNESIIEAAMNFRMKIENNEVTILGLTNDSNLVKTTIEHELGSICQQLYAIRKNGGQTKLDI